MPKYLRTNTSVRKYTAVTYGKQNISQIKLNASCTIKNYGITYLQFYAHILQQYKTHTTQPL